MSLPATFLDNAPTPAPQTTVGFKLSKPGYPADRTGANNLIFDSSWPTLAVAFEATIVNNSSSSLTHNLGFPPLTFYWQQSTDPVTGTTIMTKSVASVNKTQVLSLPTGVTIHVKCFQLDLSTDIDYVLAPGDSFKSPYDSNFGVKVAKPNKDINSTDLRNFSIHSRCQGPLVLAVKTQATQNTGNAPSTVVQYTSKQATASWIYGFILSASGTYTYARMYTQAYPRLFTDGFTSYLQYISPDVGATIVVLRDPMFASTQTTVQF